MRKTQNNKADGNMQGFSQGEMLEILLAAMQMANKFDKSRTADLMADTAGAGDADIVSDKERSKYFDDYLNQQTLKYFSRQSLF